MKDPIQRYLKKRADLASRALVAGNLDRLDTIVVIPAFAEFDFLPRTLTSLAANATEDLSRTLVICVVNNRVDADPDLIDNNSRTLELLAGTSFGALRLAYIDAATPGTAFSSGAGVGSARKLGLDWGAHVLANLSAPQGALVSLDADTVVEKNYLSAIRSHFSGRDAWAAVIDYAHPVEGTPVEQAAILCYELFLRYHVIGLRYAGSPYAFHTIGSAMACTASAYVAVSGMNRREAGEDFYFLQELAKTGHVDGISGTTVHPSGRGSNRVPFGTGARVRRFVDGSHDEYRLYHPECYRILRDWLAAVGERLSEEASAVLECARSISTLLAAFLVNESFEDTWPRLQQNARDESALLAQFHRWFDGLKTLRFIHHLQDNGYPEMDMFEAIDGLLIKGNGHASGTAGHDLRNSLDAQRELLERLRRSS